jgi:hypothetical protein
MPMRVVIFSGLLFFTGCGSTSSVSTPPPLQADAGSPGASDASDGACGALDQPCCAGACRDGGTCTANVCGRGRIVLFGGSVANGPVGDTWVFDGSAWSQKTPAPSPPARSNHGMAALKGKVVLFGGVDANAQPLADTWEWDGAIWQRRFPMHSPTHGGEHMARSGDAVFLYADGASPELWEWDGNDWTLHPLASAPGDGTSLDEWMVRGADGLYLVQSNGGRGETSGPGKTFALTAGGWELRGSSPALALSWHAVSAYADGMLLVQPALDANRNTTLDSWAWDGKNWNPLPRPKVAMPLSSTTTRTRVSRPAAAASCCSPLPFQAPSRVRLLRASRWFGTAAPGTKS